MITFYQTKVVVNIACSKQSELLTMQHQYDDTACGIWKAERRIRIASSVASSTVHSMLYSKFNGNEATCWGLGQEKVIASQYIVTKWGHL